MFALNHIGLCVLPLFAATCIGYIHNASGLAPSPCPMVASAEVPVQFTILQPAVGCTRTVDVISPSVFVTFDAPVSLHAQIP